MMDACPECEGLLIGDMDDDNFSASQEPIGYYCPGCGWSSDDMDFNETVGPPDRECDECKKVDQTAFCRNDMYADDKGEHLCFDCAGKNGFCFGCGNFSAGIESFDFSPIQGYCSNCVDQIKSTVADDDNDSDDDYYFEDWMRMQ